MDLVELKERILKTIKVDNLGDTRIFNLAKSFIGDKEKTIDFMVNELGYELWYINKIIYIQEYNRKQYLLTKASAS